MRGPVFLNPAEPAVGQRRRVEERADHRTAVARPGEQAGEHGSADSGTAGDDGLLSMRASFAAGWGRDGRIW